MLLIEVIYTSAAIMALSACVPQILRLLRTKRSDGFSLHSWLMWSCTQAATLMYIVAIGNALMMVVNFAWLGFYAFMSYLIIVYRVKPLAAESVDTSADLT